VAEQSSINPSTPKYVKSCPSHKHPEVRLHPYILDRLIAGVSKAYPEALKSSNLTLMIRPSRSKNGDLLGGSRTMVEWMKKCWITPLLAVRQRKVEEGAAINLITNLSPSSPLERSGGAWSGFFTLY
jgi:hypothetical protein